MTGLVERFIPRPQVSASHEVRVAAPADVVYETACAMDLRAVWAIDAIFRMRERLLGARPGPAPPSRGLVADMAGIGWGRLAERPRRELVMGAVTQPWEADVVFRALPPADFTSFAEPGLVKIAWTLEAEPIDATHTLFRSQTRVVATDEPAWRRFRSYWRRFGIGIVAIRWLLLRALRRDAVRRFEAQRERAAAS